MLSLALALPLLAQHTLPEDYARTPPAVTYPVTRVVDGDTIWVERDGELEKLRLLSVDTEEKIGPWHPDSSSKPQTVFGEETKLWAQELFASLAEAGERPRVGLRFPGGREERGRFGRLLAEVTLPDGTDYGLLLVRTGRSPYFTKYGHSRLRHADFVRAQTEARAEGLGIWDPRTNEPAEPGVRAAKRDYARLLPWWEARARAIEAFRARAAASKPGTLPCGAADAADDLARLAAASEAGEVEVFGTIARFYEEDDGSLTCRFDAVEGELAFRAVVEAPRSPELEELLKASRREYRQNYLWVRGRILRGPRGWRMVASEPERWRLAGPEPAEFTLEDIAPAGPRSSRARR